MVTSAGIEPALPGWKPDVLTVILRGREFILPKNGRAVNTKSSRLGRPTFIVAYFTQKVKHLRPKLLKKPKPPQKRPNHQKPLLETAFIQIRRTSKYISLYNLADHKAQPDNSAPQSG